ncbi:flavonoid 3-O-glucosyltransferase-like [Neltuma alba]|uniref:flavonoid 3-O-glucosyltransferase-like n=1 Tax=Neltuma alba TaxID=207710 RepID=UPI0010A54816|nr:flavonoid 3-O-glucosyltransferase-like [Prosopis alba]
MKAASEIRHVAVLAFPFGTHSIPLLDVIQRIASDSPEVIFSFFCTAPNIANIGASIFLKFPNIKPYNVHDGLPAGYVPSGHPLEPLHLFLRAMPENYRRAMDQAVTEKGRKITCIVTDAFLWFGAEMAEQMHAKWVPLWMAGPHALLTHVVTDLLREKFPCDDDDKHGCLQWLDKQKTASVLYIAFGSVILPPPHELSALAQALEEGKFPYIWSFRGSPEKQLPEGFLKRTGEQGIVVPWAPQLDILKHASTSVFMTHCGWNSILESIVGGVPMICRPFFGDQRLNTLMLEGEWGVAMAVDNGVITKNEIIRVLESSLTGEKGKMMRSNVTSLKQSAMKAIEPSGSSTQNFRTLIDLVTT